MSKERALLKEALYVIGEYTEDAQERTEILIDEIEKLLDQPEQEPVAWMQDSIELYVLEEKSAIRGYVIPLYTAPPTRESLTPRQGLEEYKKGYARAEIDLKREPLSETAVCEILIKKEWRGFVDLVRIIEKEHGIGGGNE